LPICSEQIWVSGKAYFNSSSGVGKNKRERVLFNRPSSPAELNTFDIWLATAFYKFPTIAGGIDNGQGKSGNALFQGGLHQFPG
jgi:hypothetical protein